MVKFKGTKGTWKVVDYGVCLAIETKLENGQDHAVFTDQFCHASKFNGDKKANALLISKAPEILEMLDILANCNPHHQRYQELRIASNKLIKEATEI